MALAEKEVSPIKYPHIWVDENGAAHLEGSRAKVYQIAADHIHKGLSAPQSHRPL